MLGSPSPGLPVLVSPANPELKSKAWHLKDWLLRLGSLTCQQATSAANKIRPKVTLRSPTLPVTFGFQTSSRNSQKCLNVLNGTKQGEQGVCSAGMACFHGSVGQVYGGQKAPKKGLEKAAGLRCAPHSLRSPAVLLSCHRQP